MKAARAAAKSPAPQFSKSFTRAWLWIGAVLIICMTELAYVPAMSGGFIWDDDQYVINNKTLRDSEGLRQIWFVAGATPQYYPLVFTSLWIEHRLWELHPTGYHIVNVALHIIASMLLWAALTRLGLGMGTAWVCAAVFAVHPVHTESVAWITERKNVLSGVFYLASLLLGLNVFRLEQMSDSAPDAQTGSRTKRKQQPMRIAADSSFKRRALIYAGMLALFIAALLSKSVTCSLPAVLAVLIWWRRGTVRAQEWLALAPMFAIGVLFALNTVAVERRHVGVEMMHLDYSFIERCLIAGRALWFYASKIIWPHPIIFIYPRWHISAAIWWQYLFPLAALAVIIALWLLRGRMGRGPLAAVLIFCGTLVPALGFIDVYPMVYSFVADHFQYLASISLIVLIVATLAAMLRSCPRARTGLCAIVLIALSLMCFREGAKYRDLIALWTDTIAKNPHAAMAHTNLANILITDATHRDEAARLYRASLSLNDPALHPIVLSKAHYGLGMYLISQYQPEEALVEFQQAVALTPDQPMSYYGEGFALESLGRLDEAIAKFQRALELRPGLAQATDALARVMHTKERSAPSEAR